MATKINKTFVDSLPFTDKGQAFFWDEALPCFGVYVGTVSKTFCVQQRIGNKTKRVVLGKYPAMTAEQARSLAKVRLGELAQGIDHTQQKREQAVKAVTLGEVFEAFLQARDLKPKTVKDYKAVMHNVYGDWQKLPITNISRDMVERRHTKTGSERGAAYANLGARTLRSVLNYASAKYEVKGVSVLLNNPVSRISQTRAWFKVERRTGHLKPHQLEAWFNAVLAVENNAIRDYLQFTLLTGCRKNEGLKLEWRDVDLIDKSFIIRDPKNSRPIQLPLSDYLSAMLAARKTASKSSYVFGGLVEPKRQVANIINQTGDSFSLHDLRRSFITICESLDISSYAVKALVNHKTGDDVTSGYIQLSVERLRKPMQQVTDYILKAAKLKR